MATVTMNVPDKLREAREAGTSSVDFTYTGTPAGNVIRALLYTTMTIDQNTVQTLADLSGTDRSAGGNACANATVSAPEVDGDVIIDVDDPAIWAEDAGGFSDVRRIVFAHDNGGAQGTWEIVSYSDDLGEDKGNTDGDFEVTIGAEGLLKSVRV